MTKTGGEMSANQMIVDLVGVGDCRHITRREARLNECTACGARDCPYGEPLHYHHDDCPACYFEEQRRIKEVKP